MSETTRFEVAAMWIYGEDYARSGRSIFDYAASLPEGRARTVHEFVQEYEAARQRDLPANARDTARLDWLERWLPAQPSRRLLTWDRDGREFTVFQSHDDVQRPGIAKKLRPAIDDAMRWDERFGAAASVPQEKNDNG